MLLSKGNIVKIKSSNPVNFRNIVRLPAFLIGGIKFRAAGKFYTPKPLFSTIRVTHRCNARCVSCVFWKEKDRSLELSPHTIEEIYKDELFSSLEMLTLSGGEATLREDLADIAEAVLKSCRTIKGVTLCTNGFDNHRVIRAVNSLLQLVQRRGNIRLYVSVSFDGVGSLHERIRGVPDAFEKVTKTLADLKKYHQAGDLSLSVNGTVQPLNVSHLKEIVSYCETNKYPLSLSPICTSDIFTDDDESKKCLQFSPAQLKELQETVKNELLPRLRTFNRAFWQDYLRLINGAERRVPCLLLHHFFQIDASGDMRGCDFDNEFIYGNIRDAAPHRIWFSDSAKQLRDKIRKNDCPGCSVNCNVGYSLEKEFFYYARYLAKEKLQQWMGRDDGR